MNPKERIALIRLIALMIKNQGYCREIGIQASLNHVPIGETGITQKKCSRHRYGQDMEGGYYL